MPAHNEAGAPFILLLDHAQQTTSELLARAKGYAPGGALLRAFAAAHCAPARRQQQAPLTRCPTAVQGI
mgnify:CR=1 FL=1